MATQPQTALDLDMFAFRPSEMAGILEAAGLTPIHGSPFRRLYARPDDEAREVARRAGPGACAAAARIAAPDQVFGVVTALPPEPPDFLWLYGSRADMDLAFHQEDENGMHRLAWPVDTLALLDLAAAPLDLMDPVESYAVSLALGREEFSALAALSDFVQADAMQALLLHEPPRSEPPTFRVDDLVALAHRASQSGDLRWMVARAALLSPIALEFGEEPLRKAVGSLESAGLLQGAEGLYEITPLLHQISILTSTCTGLTAISNRSRPEGHGAWNLEHVALARGPESLLLFEFEDVTADDFLVSIDDITPPLAFEWLQKGLRFEDIPPVRRFCTRCGRAVEAGKAFCTGCGSPVAEGGRHA